MNIMYERELEKRLGKAIRARKGIYMKFVSPNCRGVPDRIILLNGKTFFIEVKRPGGVISPIQKLMIKRLRRIGVPAFVIENDDELKLVLEFIDKEAPKLEKSRFM